jgi:hypothetical protein
MGKPWRFDELNPYEDVYEESLLAEMSPLASEIVQTALAEIQEDPVRQDFVDVSGERFYIATTAPISEGGITVPPMLIAYTLNSQQLVIRPVLVSRAAEVQSHVNQELERAVANAPANVPPFQDRILDPSEDTSLSKQSIEKAVKRVTHRAKAS